MKLYATTTSERASKGQGGNKFLEIVLKAELDTGYETIGIIYLDAYDDGEYVVKWQKDNNEAEILTQGQLKQKGKKKTGECEHIKRNGAYFTGKCPICN